MLNNFLNLLKITIKSNKKGFIINNNNKNLNLIKVFIKIGIIKFVKKNKLNNKFIIYINYVNNKPVFVNIINLYKKSNLKYISYKKIFKYKNKYNWIFLISSDLGIINSFEAIKKKRGGLLISKIWN